jgi:hypothetical protein
VDLAGLTDWAYGRSGVEFGNFTSPVMEELGRKPPDA